MNSLVEPLSAAVCFSSNFLLSRRYIKEGSMEQEQEQEQEQELELEQ